MTQLLWCPVARVRSQEAWIATGSVLIQFQLQSLTPDSVPPQHVFLCLFQIMVPISAAAVRNEALALHRNAERQPLGGM